MANDNITLEALKANPWIPMMMLLLLLMMMMMVMVVVVVMVMVVMVMMMIDGSRRRESPDGRQTSGRAWRALH